MRREKIVRTSENEPKKSIRRSLADKSDLSVDGRCKKTVTIMKAIAVIGAWMRNAL
jgi:hypothetical protein